MSKAGETLFGYELLNKLGQGGYGEVFLAREFQSGRQVAIKMLLPLYCRDLQLRRRLLAEANALRTLQHSQIVRLIDVRDSDESICFIMEYLEGDTLRKLLSNGALPIRDAIEIAIHIGSALEAAHSASIIHRDIKPENIIHSQHRGAVLLDFGLSRSLEEGVTVTKAGVLVGTWKYMAPEVFRGERADARSDLFSLAVVLYECLTGYRPFDGEHEAAIMYAVLNDPPHDLNRAPRPISHSLKHFLSKALQKDQRLRYQTAAAFVSDLRRVLSGEELAEQLSLSTTIPRTDVIKVALLRLENRGSPDTEYAAFGVTEALIANLSQNTHMHLVPLLRVLALDPSAKSREEIAHELDVDYLITGTCEVADGTLRVCGTISDCRDRLPLWSHEWQGSLRELTELCAIITNDLLARFGVSPEENASQPRVLSRRLPDPIAYECFLRGRYLFEHKKSAADVEVAAGLFRQSLSIDPRIAEASLGVARIHSYQGNNDLAIQELLRRRLLLSDQDESGLRIEIELALAECYLRVSDWRQAYESASEAKRLALDAANPGQEARALTILIDILEPQARYDEAILYYRRAVQINQQLRRKDKIATAIKSMGVIHQRRGYFSRALASYDEALELCRSHELVELEAKIVNNIGLIQMQTGRLDKAREQFERALSLHRQLGELTSIAVNLNNLGVIHHTIGSFRSALECFREAAESATEVGDLKNISLALENQAKVLIVLGEYDDAELKNRQAQEIAERLQYQLVLITTERNFGDMALYQLRFREAEDHFDRSKQLAFDADIRTELLGSLLSLAKLQQRTGDWERCLRSAEHALHLVAPLHCYSNAKTAAAYRAFARYALTNQRRQLQKLLSLAGGIHDRLDCQQALIICRLAGQALSMFPISALDKEKTGNLLHRALDRAVQLQISYEQDWIRELLPG